MRWLSWGWAVSKPLGIGQFLSSRAAIRQRPSQSARLAVVLDRQVRNPILGNGRMGEARLGSRDLADGDLLEPASVPPARGRDGMAQAGRHTLTESQRVRT